MRISKRLHDGCRRVSKWTTRPIRHVPTITMQCFRPADRSYEGAGPGRPSIGSLIRRIMRYIQTTVGLAVCIFAISSTPHASAQSIIFVNAAAKGLNDGSSWTDARTNLQKALAGARPGDALWVASGVYRPGTSRASTFQLVDAISLFGGFRGDEDPDGFDLNARNLDLHPTVLDGHIGSPGDADNVFHVLTAASVSRTALLDGFTVTGGSANGVTILLQDVGAGLLNTEASPTIRNCTFVDNAAGTRGGAVHVDGGSPLIINCRFFNNRTTVTQAANNIGGAIYANAAPGQTAHAQFINCLFVGNRAGVGSGGSGGVLYDDLQSLTSMVNCTLLHNFADTHGGGIVGSPVLTNCILRGNHDRDGTGRLSQIRGSAIVNYSYVQGDWSGTGNVGDDPLLVDELGPDGVPGTMDDDAQLMPGSPCIDAGDSEALPATVTRDLAGAARFIDDPVTPNTGRPAGETIVDMGVYEYQASCDGAANCDNGLFCDGVEACVAGRCAPGTSPSCDDGVACTRDSCRESDHSCVHEPDDGRCDNGVFCDGFESCDALSGCHSGDSPFCDDGIVCTLDACDEGLRSCTHVADPTVCDDGVFCNGEEICNTTLGCRPGSPVNCDDGIECTTNLCDETASACSHEPDDDLCDDELFCNGKERCTLEGCVAGVSPCEDPTQCDEKSDQCLSGPLDCVVDSDCDDTNPCTNDSCTGGACVHANNDVSCDDGNACTTSDMCSSGACTGTPIAGCGVIVPPPAVDPDDDGDGVGNADDRCSATKLDTIVDSRGCSCDQLDDDGDGIDNCADKCPSDTSKAAPGECGCGIVDFDSDGDGSPDCVDLCPNDATKSAPGVCGCGVPERDSDGDATPDCVDRCPTDSLKTGPGICGCGVADEDADGDGVADCADGCPIDPNKTEPGPCRCGVADADADGDGVPDCNDSCPLTPPETLTDELGCPVEPQAPAGLPDSDGDGVSDGIDLCPQTPPDVPVDVLGCDSRENDGIGRGFGEIPNRRNCGTCGAFGMAGVWSWSLILCFLLRARVPRSNWASWSRKRRGMPPQRGKYREYTRYMV